LKAGALARAHGRDLVAATGPHLHSLLPRLNEGSIDQTSRNALRIQHSARPVGHFNVMQLKASDLPVGMPQNSQ
jgi:hypothetical protein